jgi:hypothetical protein
MLTEFNDVAVMKSKERNQLCELAVGFRGLKRRKFLLKCSKRYENRTGMNT